MPTESLTFIDRTHPEHQRMWARLSADPINAGDVVCQEPASGESWQYMGTVRDVRGTFHEFRHRLHPRTLKREYRRIPTLFPVSFPTWAE
jgi:hypothetical protein